MSFNYEVDKEYDYVVDEKANTFLALRKIQWGGKGDFKLDIRKWYVNSEGEEVCGKGVSFLTEDGPHELTQVLVDTGYGDTKQLLDSLKQREDFEDALNGKEESKLLDPREVLL